MSAKADRRFRETAELLEELAVRVQKLERGVEELADELRWFLLHVHQGSEQLPRGVCVHAGCRNGRVPHIAKGPGPGPGDTSCPNLAPVERCSHCGRP